MSITAFANTKPMAATPGPKRRVALVGNPNAGKTALFNALTGLRAKTANYPGITVDIRQGKLQLPNVAIELIDLPGMYSLDALTPEEETAAQLLRGEHASGAQPDAILLVLDATNIERNLVLASEVLDLERPVVVAMTLSDAADKSGISVHVKRLEEELKCRVVPVSARVGTGLNELRESLSEIVQRQPLPLVDSKHVSCTSGCTGCTFAARFNWAAKVAGRTVEHHESPRRTTEVIDSILTRPAVGMTAFLSLMLVVFYLIFSLAGIPMMLIEEGFTWVAGLVGRLIPTAAVAWYWKACGVVPLSLLVFAVAYRAANVKWTRVSSLVAVITSALVSLLPLDEFRSLLVDGVIGGIGGVIVFLPQICILFFFIAVLEDSGYLARAAFVMERVMRGFGLPGKAFVPMLSAHACAIPGIMAARVIENWRDRLVTILVLPLLTCSARLPVYAMIAALLFGESPGKAAMMFLGAYVLGIVAALFSAFCLKMSILRGETVPLVLELPPYRLPSLRNALFAVLDRATVFVKRAGSVILLMSVVLWVLASYPKLPEDQVRTDVAARLESLHVNTAGSDDKAAEPFLTEAAGLLAQEELAYSWAGRAGRLVEPVFRPLGFDWKMNVGVISSFAAREVIVSTLAIIYGLGEDVAEDEKTLTETLRGQKRADGAPVYNTPTCMSLLVFYVLAMQCLPTQAVTYRETGSWKWALFQLGYMTILAYVAALLTFQVATYFVTNDMVDRLAQAHVFLGV